MLELMLWITKRKLRIDKPIPTAYPFRETLLALWPVEVHCLSSCNKLDQNYSKGINISFFCDLTGFSIFWSQIPAAEKNILFYTAIACGSERQKAHHLKLPKCSDHSCFNTSIAIRLPPC